MKVDGSLKSLLQGVSQQPPRDRLPGQCSLMLNMSADPVLGLTRRPPTDLVAELDQTSTLKAWGDFQTRNGSKFVVALKSDIVKVWDRNGVPKSVTMTASPAYLAITGDLKMGQIEDQTIIANTGVNTAQLTTVKTYFNKAPSGQKPSGIVQVLGGAYSRVYQIFKDGALAAMYTPPDGSNIADNPYVRTSKIAEVLAWCLTQTTAPTGIWGGGARNEAYTANGLFSGVNWTVTRVSDIILISSNTNVVFQLTCTDDQGNIAMKTMTETVPDTSDLPAFAPQGYLIRVAKETDPLADLYLAFFRDDGVLTVGTGFGNKGYWQEVVADNTKYKFDLNTMPYVLEYRPLTDDFEFRQGNWADRRTGTTTSNPDPSFLGNPIVDISTFQSRLVFLSGSNVIMSRTKVRSDFWFESTAANADTDPIDISSTAVQASSMLAAIPHNRDLVVFSTQGQFIVFGRTAVTPSNSALVLTTAFESDLKAKPTPSGRNIFFASKYGSFTTMREFFAQGFSDINDSRPITAHVNQYIKGRATKLTSSSNYNLLLVSTDSDQTVQYPYQFIWSDDSKVQSAWSSWMYDQEIVHSFFDEELIYFISRRLISVGVYRYFLKRMSLNILPDTGIEYTPYLDSRFDVFAVNKVFILPEAYLADSLPNLVFVQGANCPNPGLPSPIKSLDFVGGNWQVTLKYDMLGGDLIGGIRFLSMYMPTMPFVKDSDNVVVGTGNLKVKHFLVALQKTGFIAGNMLSKYGDSEVVEFNGRIIGAVDDLIGQQPLSDFAFVVPFRGNTKNAELNLFSDSHLPFTILDIEWLGQYNKRGRRIASGGGGAG